MSTIRSRYSPWRETIPLNRNCSTALIPDLYCACDSHIMMETNSSLITDASYALVDYLNEILIDYRSVCHRLVLNQTRLAEVNIIDFCKLFQNIFSTLILYQANSTEYSNRTLS